MPRMGTSIIEGEVIAWLKRPGDRVEAEETLCEISTDKVDSECPAPVAGVLVEILVAAGEVADVGSTIARIAAEGSSDNPSEPPSRGNGAGRKRLYSPVARRVAADGGVDLCEVAGTGLNGRVTRRDVERFIADRGGDPPLHTDSPYRPPPPAGTDDGGSEVGQASTLGGDPRPLSRMRVAIGDAMRRSLDTAATCHTVVECDVTTLERRRRELKMTALPLVARATIEVLGGFPDLNATLDGRTLTRFEPVHLGIAVSLGDDGLIVPVVRDAQELSTAGLAARVKDLANRARARELLPEEVRGATFTITNPGAIGASIATPVIDLPQVAILDLEAIIRRPVVVTDDEGEESIAIRSMVNLVLGWDHRAVDGVYAARFLAALRGALEAV